MSDQLDNFENVHGRVSRVKLHEGSRVKKGYEGKKLHVYAEVPGRSTKIPMFLKTQEERDEDVHSAEIDLDKVMQKYKMLKDLGLPVVPTFRIDRKKKQILTTNVTEGGRKRIVDIHEHDYLPYFTNEKELKRTVRDINQKAYDNGILLGSNAFAVVNDPVTNYGVIYLLDLGEVRTLKENEERHFEITGRKITQEEVDHYKEHASEEFIRECIDHYYD